MIGLRLGLLVVLVLASCVNAPPSKACSETLTTTKVVSGYTLRGKGAEVFLVYDRDPERPERRLRARTPEKMLVVVDHPIIPATDAERIPPTLDVVGHNMTTGARKTFTVSSHVSELGLGVEWGTNFEFPDAGCWQLRLAAPRNTETTIVMAVD
ncbi:MAG: hypothetical protein ACRDF9_04075 [Candidatus Limnocylindria bacterium]